MIGRGTLAGLGAALALWGAATAASYGAGGNRVRAGELLYYPNGRFLKEAALGYDQAAAAGAWLRTVQYYGEHVKGDRRFDLMYHLCDVVTDLDPKFIEPYTFGAFVLFSDGTRPAEAEALLAKGRAHNPRSSEIYFESGFMEYVFLRNYSEASAYLRRAAELPGAPDYAERFAAYVAAKAGEPKTAILLWSEVARRTGNPGMKRLAEQNIARLQGRTAPGPAR